MPAMRPSSPSATASTSDGSGSEEKITSASLASARGLSAQMAPAERWWLAACLCRSWTTSLKPALCTLAAMRPPMVPSPTNPTTTLSLDIASPPLRISDFDRHQVSLCGPHCGRPACTKGEMRDDLDGHGGQLPEFNAEHILRVVAMPTSRTIPDLLDELAA